MAVTYILHNPAAGGAEAEATVRALKDKTANTVLINMQRMSSYRTFFDGLESGARVILCGGDGTLNRFINDTQGIPITTPLYYYPVGTGNDFARDLGFSRGAAPTFCIDRYLRRLPSVTVNGETRLFLNNVGFGVDGYCCEEGDRQRAQNEQSGSSKAVNYTKIAIKGLLGAFKPRDAVVTVDGKRYTYKRVWLAPAMNGRYYGGGIMAAPTQERLGADGAVSLLVFHDVGKLHALLLFPSVIKGRHLKHTRHIHLFKGQDIHVEFDRPTPLQIDGETISDVTSYTVHAPGVAEAVPPAVAAVG